MASFACVSAAPAHASPILPEILVLFPFPASGPTNSKAN